MLTELEIENFAVIEKQNIQFGSGLNVISGETGAGKSVVLQALELILGARPKTSYVRNGAESWELQAHFDLRKVPEKVLSELPDIARGTELILSRSMNSAGRGKIYINGRIGTVALLEEIAGSLINICGQGQQIKLLNSASHRELIDSYVGHNGLLAEYRQHYQLWKKTKAELDQLKNKLERDALRRAELEFIIDELGTAELQPGLRAELEKEVKRQGAAEQIIAAGQSILDIIAGNSGIRQRLSQATQEFKQIKNLDQRTEQLQQQLSSAAAEISEFHSDLERYLSGCTVDEQRLADLRERLAVIARLERKFQVDTAGLIKLLDNSKAELQAIDNPQILEQLTETEAQQSKKCLQLGAQLSSSRKKGGEALAKIVKKDLSELAMNSSLKLELESAEPGPDGCDRLQLLFAPHQGDNFRPLSQIASGGELSRITLVLKKALKEKTGVNVLVFDEVDTGVSGGVARAVGEKLKELSSDSQVICITHLPQVASLADQHFLVNKQVGKQAISVIKQLNETQRIDEIARMLAGYSITDASRESAKELLSSNN